ncbi:MAG TPA: PAS domain S-box protein [Verrucomicrobiae bacterium]|nr:PAS domain S-box protein [Verrucomicrobiae bacterium]
MNTTIRVLVIEDHPPLLRMISDMLGQAVEALFQVESTARLGDALERLAGGSIDLVLLDLNLPDSLGLDTFVSCYNRAPDIPIVVLTALEDETLAMNALREGAQDYLIKSEINPRALIRGIRYAIERKRGEEARSRLAALVESSHDAIIGLSLEGLIVSWNTGAEAMFGHSYEEVIGRPSAILLPPGHIDDMPATLKHLKAGHFVKDFETTRRTKEGRTVHLAVSVSPIKNSFGRIIGASMIARDIDEQKRHAQEQERLINELQAALAQLKTLSGLLPICACCKKIRDDQGYWTQVEVYLMARSQAEFTHGICPDCEQRYRAQIPPAPPD